MPLAFKFDEMLEEIRYFRQSACKDFLAGDADGILAQLDKNLQSIRDSQMTQPQPWQIARERPVKTRLSKGEYEPEGKCGGHHLYAEFSSIWSILPEPRSKKVPSPRTFTVTGLCSMRTEFFEAEDVYTSERRSLGSWRMEIGLPDNPTEKHPGCFFHAQILGDDGRTDPPFPHSLSVPRLPSIAITPTAVMEFVLGELFQKEWGNPALHARPELRSWGGIQKRRLKTLLNWQLEETQKASGSPWVSLKAACPKETLFVD